MGYTTEFEGQFDLDHPLTEAHATYLRQFAETRRMKRDRIALSMVPDPIRKAVGLDLGAEGGYFVGGTGMCGQDRDDSVIDYNCEPTGQPGLWCQWVPTDDNEGIEWDGTEKFYYYVEWLQYLLDHFLKPWGYCMNGVVYWGGEDRADIGIIEVVNNEIIVHEGVAQLPKARERDVPPPAPVTLSASPTYQITCPHCNDQIILANWRRR